MFLSRPLWGCGESLFAYNLFFMADALLYLVPGFLTQILLGVLLLWLFVREQDHVGLEKILLTSLIFSGLNIVIEWFLHEYLLAATLMLQWTFFVLLANRILSIPLPRASMTLFCYFSLSMGLSMIEDRLSPGERTEEELLLTEGFENSNDTDPDTSSENHWVLKVQAGTLQKKTYASKDLVLDFLYPVKETTASAAPDPTEPEIIQIAPIPPTPAPLPPDMNPGMTGEEFEDLIFSADPVEPTIPPVTSATPIPEAVPQLNYPTPDFPVQNSSSINAEQMSQIVEIKNRSTDPRYPAPDYTISAVGIGAKGHFAIVDGDMLKEGSIIYTQDTQPRGWLLYRIKKNQVYWQPLK